jgi:hypothetical protein
MDVPRDKDIAEISRLADLESDRRWDDLFASSQDVLAQLADEAHEDYLAGRTEPLDPETL